MEKSKVVEGNKLILLFMGGVVGSSTKYTDGEVVIHSIHIGDAQIKDFVNETKYHKQWNWLMPVVEKIEGLGFQMFIHNDGCYMRKWHFKGNFPYFGNIEDSKIEATYKTVVQFIQWYNLNNK